MKDDDSRDNVQETSSGESSVMKSVKNKKINSRRPFLRKEDAILMSMSTNSKAEIIKVAKKLNRDRKSIINRIE